VNPWLALVGNTFWSDALCEGGEGTHSIDSYNLAVRFHWLVATPSEICAVTAAIKSHPVKILKRLKRFLVNAVHDRGIDVLVQEQIGKLVEEEAPKFLSQKMITAELKIRKSAHCFQIWCP
jgi:hypothetical protein